MRRACALVLAALLAGCTHWHAEHNAPGLVDIRTPPADLRNEGVERPGDPGERMLAVNPGVNWLSGYRSRDDAAVLELGAEVSFLRGESERSHKDGEERLFVPKDFQLPERGYGVTFGWSGTRLVQTGDDDPDTEEIETRERLETGPFHARAYVFRNWFGGGLGWTLDPRTGDHGPEIAGHAGVFTTRMVYTRDRNFEVLLGYQLKFPLTRVESR